MLTEDEAERLLTWLADAVGGLGAARDLPQTLESTARGAVEAIPGTEGAGITELFGREQFVERVATGALPEIVDRLQHELAEGPCPLALATGRTIRVHDLGEEYDRWPKLAEAARRENVAAALCYRLDTRSDKRRMSLNLYARRPGVFDDEAVLLGELFASHASIALAHAQNSEQLTTALSTRDLIGQAKGILMERFGIDDYKAFRMLVESSQNTNLKLVDIATWLTSGVTGAED
ncbi:GAF and ANTAR domain-containing protein [Saccharopolyspora sp. ID03-671]|uniref:GAF and ANTAR domain-containing protein n=1 Tax=Saccharopolyspora sp. ID03-671 TaxID=3073066 RepID=UPI00324988FC